MGGTILRKPNDLVGKVVRVQWKDPRSQGAWTDEAHVRYIPPMQCVTWGKVLRHDAECIVVAASVSMGDEHTPPMVGDVMSIPAELVTEVTYLKNG